MVFLLHINYNTGPPKTYKLLEVILLNCVYIVGIL